MTEKKCENCKFWTLPKINTHNYIHGTCNKIQQRDYYVPDPDTFEIELAHVVDGSDYFAELRTLPDFYCCLYEEKP